jgi:hypothetical protein
MDNKGIGPIKSLVFDNEINQAIASQGEAAFKQK